MPRLAVFFLLTFLISWSAWLASWPPVTGLERAVFHLGVFAPGIVAAVLTLRHEGKAALATLLGRLVRGDVGLRWYLFALTFTATLKLTVAVIYRIVWGAWPHFGAAPWYLLLGGALLSFILFGQAGEEVGWRGYAIPRLAERLGLARASLLLGVVWAVWHLPLFLLPGSPTTGQSFPLYVVQVTGLSVVFAWLYARTGGSLLLTMLLHAAFNNTKDIVPSAVPGATNTWALSASPVGWLSVGLLWVFAGYCLARMPPVESIRDPAG
jgi:uncharacterized protein